MTTIFEVEEGVTEQVEVTDAMLQASVLASLFDEAQAALAQRPALRRDTLEQPFVDPEVHRVTRELPRIQTAPTRELPAVRGPLSSDELAAVRREGGWAWLALAAVLGLSGLVALL